MNNPDIGLRVYSFKGTAEEFMETDEFKEFNSTVKVYMKQVYEMCASRAKNQDQLKLLDDWWNGKSLWKWNECTKTHSRADGYEQYSEKDWYDANSLILTATSAGCGWACNIA